MSEHQYFLARHVHLCVTDNYAVLLDLRRDKYIGVAREHLPALAASVNGWPGMVQSDGAPSRSAKALIDQMLTTGMLTTDPAVGKAARALSMPRPQFPGFDADLRRRPLVTYRHVWGVLWAAATAKALLKWRPIETVVARIQKRKQQHGANPFDLDAARPWVEAFVYLRPLYFTTKDECLYDSLVLVELLARHNLFPEWIFGVSTNPFKAHSWVQAGDRVLNDQPERIARFMPILSV